MTDFPGYYMLHCTNCYATSHSDQHCPYNEGDDMSDCDYCHTDEAVYYYHDDETGETLMLCQGCLDHVEGNDNA